MQVLRQSAPAVLAGVLTFAPIGAKVPVERRGGAAAGNRLDPLVNLAGGQGEVERDTRSLGGDDARAENESFAPSGKIHMRHCSPPVPAGNAPSRALAGRTQEAYGSPRGPGSHPARLGHTHSVFAMHNVSNRTTFRSTGNRYREDFAVKKFILAVAVAAVASMAVARPPWLAWSATSATAKSPATQPAGEVGNWSNLWTHDYRSRSTRTTARSQAPATCTDTTRTARTPPTRRSVARSPRTGQSQRGAHLDGVEYKLANAKFGDTETIATRNLVVPWKIEMKVTNRSSPHDRLQEPRRVRSSQGGGSDAAHSCIGMPIKESNANK